MLFEVTMLDEAAPPPTTCYGPFEDWFRAFRSTLRPLCEELLRYVVTTPLIFLEDWLLFCGPDSALVIFWLLSLVLELEAVAADMLRCAAPPTWCAPPGPLVGFWPS